MPDNKLLHDLKGQIAAITEGMQLLLENSDEEFKKRILQLMDKKCNDLKQVIQTLSQVKLHE